jgi:hypothetical protein
MSISATIHKNGLLKGLRTMANGTPMSPGKIITVAITAMIAISSITTTYTVSAINRQSAAIDKQNEAMVELTALVYTKMDDRYRRAEAVVAHDNIKDRIRATEKRDDILESKLDSHVSDDG